MDVVLRLYHDVVGLQEVTEDNLDIIKNAILAKCHPSVGELYVKIDDSALTYENLWITAIDHEDGASQSGQVKVNCLLGRTSHVQELPLPWQVRLRG
jgi:hypothetical protein